MEWVGWLATTERSDQALILGAILLFCVLAPMALARGGRRALVVLWIAVLLPLVAVGWRRWRVEYNAESASLPLADIAYYTLPVGGAMALAAAAVMWAARNQRSRGVQHVAALVAAYGPLPVVFAVAVWLGLLMYMMTGGFI
jgi:hypothetical protein